MGIPIREIDDYDGRLESFNPSTWADPMLYFFTAFMASTSTSSVKRPSL